MLNVKKLLTKVMEMLPQITDVDGWHTLTNGVRYCKQNDVVYVDCYLSSGLTISTSYITLATLPAGYRPSTYMYITSGTNSTYNGVAYVAPDGTVGAKTASGSTNYCWFQIAYPLGGVIRTLKKAISNLYREGVAVC